MIRKNAHQRRDRVKAATIFEGIDNAARLWIHRRYEGKGDNLQVDEEEVGMLT